MAGESNKDNIFGGVGGIQENSPNSVKKITPLNLGKVSPVNTQNNFNGAGGIKDTSTFMEKVNHKYQNLKGSTVGYIDDRVKQKFDELESPKTYKGQPIVNESYSYKEKGEDETSPDSIHNKVLETKRKFKIFIRMMRLIWSAIMVVVDLLLMIGGFIMTILPIILIPAVIIVVIIMPFLILLNSSGSLISNISDFFSGYSTIMKNDTEKARFCQAGGYAGENGTFYGRTVNRFYSYDLDKIYGTIRETISRSWVIQDGKKDLEPIKWIMYDATNYILANGSLTDEERTKVLKIQSDIPIKYATAEAEGLLKGYTLSATGEHSGIDIPQGISNTSQTNTFIQPVGSGDKAILNIIEQSANEVGVDPTMLQAIAIIESGLNPSASAGTSSAKGLFQFLDSTWTSAIKNYGPKYGLNGNISPYDPRAASLMGAEYVKNSINSLSSIKSNVTVTDVYLAHFLGGTGAKIFLSANPNDIAANVRPSAAKSNKSVFYEPNGRARTVAEVYNLFTDRLVNKAAAKGVSVSLAYKPNQSYINSSDSEFYFNENKDVYLYEMYSFEDDLQAINPDKISPLISQSVSNTINNFYVEWGFGRKSGIPFVNNWKKYGGNFVQDWTLFSQYSSESVEDTVKTLEARSAECDVRTNFVQNACFEPLDISFEDCAKFKNLANAIEQIKAKNWNGNWIESSQKTLLENTPTENTSQAGSTITPVTESNVVPQNETKQTNSNDFLDDLDEYTITNDTYYLIYIYYTINGGNSFGSGSQCLLENPLKYDCLFDTKGVEIWNMEVIDQIITIDKDIIKYYEGYKNSNTVIPTEQKDYFYNYLASKISVISGDQNKLKAIFQTKENFRKCIEGNAYVKKECPKSGLPVKYSGVCVTAYYNDVDYPPQYKPHTGVDFNAKFGTDIYAYKNGTVVAAKYTDAGGNAVIVDHGGGETSYYGHLSSFKVKVGDTVDNNTVIAASGNTGKWTTGAHLHFQININGKSINPFSATGPYTIVPGGIDFIPFTKKC